MTKEEALDLALEALEELNDTKSYWWQEVDEATIKKIDPAITAIKQARSAPVQSCYCPNCEAMGKELAALKAQPAPVQEPVAITEQMAFAFHNAITDGAIGTDDLMEIMRGLEAAFAHITAPPAAQRQWVGLTDEEEDAAFEQSMEVRPKDASNKETRRLYARAIEAKLKEKNQ